MNESIRINDFRDTFATLLANSGRSILEISRVLGHSSVKFSEHYSNLSVATLKEAAKSASVMINLAMGGTST